ncbi:hypothetical protein EV10_1284 [Prochlorococcus marinus str. SS51]|nr:hypothetical protein EV04_0744 [Prochlorococcus marinus str. LG]KGG18868.1 hypothetical protein EV08_1354 [Prochlorococcus marinus str. SS2]KGG23594.1 hypothetical protein EV09_1219 [Prochlorococcus marinus str. SS35]KGG32170.1 hypothetical protein EV10_1284 [Prochlorococcus marinus str. SS51]
MDSRLKQNWAKPNNLIFDINVITFDFDYSCSEVLKITSKYFPN